MLTIYLTQVFSIMFITFYLRFEGLIFILINWWGNSIFQYMSTLYSIISLNYAWIWPYSLISIIIVCRWYTIWIIWQLFPTLTQLSQWGSNELLNLIFPCNVNILCSCRSICEVFWWYLIIDSILWHFWK